MFYFCRSSWIWISFMTQLRNYFYACMLKKISEIPWYYSQSISMWCLYMTLQRITVRMPSKRLFFAFITLWFSGDCRFRTSLRYHGNLNFQSFTTFLKMIRSNITVTWMWIIFHAVAMTTKIPRIACSAFYHWYFKLKSRITVKNLLTLYITHLEEFL